jgi:superkiller protein 3
MNRPFIGLLIVFVLGAGCVHRTTARNFGLPAARSAASPDSSLRAVFHQQTKGAFDPLSDDARVQTFQNRLKVNREDLSARLELAAVYESYRLYDEALEQYTNAYALVRSEQSILGIARCDQALGRTWQAIPLLEQFLKESPSAGAWNALGLLYDSAGNLPAGESAFKEALAKSGEFGEWHNNLGYNLLLQNKIEAAESEFRRALELNPKSATSHNNLGALLARRGDLQAALEQFQFSADAATAHNNLAVVLLEMGKYEQSREELVKALALRRYFAPALANFKLVQDRMRQRAELQKAGRQTQSNVRVASVEQESNRTKEPEDK